MVLPQFNDNGDLPVGIHPAILEEVLNRFGQGSVQRKVVAGRLQRIYRYAAETGKLARIVVFGSFVTAKMGPNDVDVVLMMEDGFDASSLVGESALLFDHMSANVHFGASVFWTTRSGALGGEQAMLEHWQIRRDGGRRGIVEIVRDPS